MGRRKGRWKPVSADQRKQIVTLSESGMSPEEVGRIMNRAPSTVQHILMLYRTKNSIVPRRTWKHITELDKEALKKLVIKNKHANEHTNYSQLSMLWSAVTGKQISTDTCSKYVKEIEKEFHEARFEEKSALCQNRLTWAEQHQNWTTDQWDSVHFSGECRFEAPTTCDTQITSTNKAQPRVASVLAWGFMSARGVGSLHFIQDNLSSEDYIELLDNYIKPKSDEYKAARCDFRFQQDRTICYEAKKWFFRTDVTSMPWVPFSPNLSPMNTLWQSMKEALSETRIRNETELRLELQSIWYSFGPKECKSVVHTMPERIQGVIDRCGEECRVYNLERRDES